MRMLDVLERFLSYHAVTYSRLDGSTKPQARIQIMEQFNRDPKIFCMILSTRSGGLGVNLIGADTVIFYDSDWNPTVDAQAQDRCHRIGQTKEVNVYRMVCKDTVEERILETANSKRNLADLTIEKGGFHGVSMFSRDILLKGLINPEFENDLKPENIDKSRV